MNPRRNRLSTLFGVAVVAVVVLAACSSAIEPDTPGAPSDAASPDDPLVADFLITVYHGEEAVDGQNVRFSELLGQGKPVVLNLWAALCPPCRLEMPEFQEVSAEFGDEVVFFGLDVGPFTNLGSSEDGQELVQQLGVTYPTGTTDNADVVKEYKLIGMPTTYFISPSGEIVEQWTGLLTKSKLTELVEALLESSSS
jgi:thiol-disulfide isomerase/thioredoxin